MKVNKLRGIIAENGLSQAKVAQYIGISERSFYDKMKRKSFLVEEAEKMVNLLHIENPEEIFFRSE